MQEYEITYLVDPKLDEKSKLELDEVIDKKILDNKGEVSYTSETDAPGSRRRLNYPIKDQRVVWLRVVQAKFNPNKIEKIRTIIRKQKDVLRVSVLQTSRREEVSGSALEAASKPDVKPEIEEKDKVPAKKVTMKEVEGKIEEALEEEVK
jgi:ribosomal protein S6